MLTGLSVANCIVYIGVPFVAEIDWKNSLCSSSVTSEDFLRGKLSPLRARGQGTTGALAPCEDKVRSRPYRPTVPLGAPPPDNH